MYDVELEVNLEEDTDLKKVGLELMFMTPQKCSHEDGITAVELAKLLEMPIDIVKKKLRQRNNECFSCLRRKPKSLHSFPRKRA